MLVKAVQIWVKPEVDPPSVGAAARILIRDGHRPRMPHFSAALRVGEKRRFCGSFNDTRGLWARDGVLVERFRIGSIWRSTLPALALPRGV